MTRAEDLFEAHLTVADLDRAIEFYRDVVGLPLALLYAQMMRTWVEVPILSWRRRHRQTVQQMVSEPLSLSDASITLGAGSVQKT